MAPLPHVHSSVAACAAPEEPPQPALHLHSRRIAKHAAQKELDCGTLGTPIRPCWRIPSSSMTNPPSIAQAHTWANRIVNLCSNSSAANKTRILKITAYVL